MRIALALSFLVLTLTACGQEHLVVKSIQLVDDQGRPTLMLETNEMGKGTITVLNGEIPEIVIGGQSTPAITIEGEHTKTLITEALTYTDSRGQTKARYGPESMSINLAGSPSIKLATTPGDGPTINVANSGQSILTVNVDGHGAGQLTTFKNGLPHTQLGSSPGGNGRISNFSGGALIASMWANEDFSGRIETFDTQGQTLVCLASGKPSGCGSMTIHADNEIIASLEVSPGGEGGHFQMGSSRTKHSVVISTSENTSGRMNLYSEGNSVIDIDAMNNGLITLKKMDQIKAQIGTRGDNSYLSLIKDDSTYTKISSIRHGGDLTMMSPTGRICLTTKYRHPKLIMKSGLHQLLVDTHDKIFLSGFYNDQSLWTLTGSKLRGSYLELYNSEHKPRLKLMTDREYGYIDDFKFKPEPVVTVEDDDAVTSD